MLDVANLDIAQSITPAKKPKKRPHLCACLGAIELRPRPKWTLMMNRLQKCCPSNSSLSTLVQNQRSLFPIRPNPDTGTEQLLVSQDLRLMELCLEKKQVRSMEAIDGAVVKYKGSAAVRITYQGQ